MAASLPDASAAANDLAEKIISGAADAVDFAAELGVKLPFVGPIFKMINAIRERVDKVEGNREELVLLHERCSRITASFVVECKTGSSGFDAAPLKSLVHDVDMFVTDCQQKSWGGEMRKAHEVEEKIEGLHERFNQLAADMGLAGIGIVVATVNEIHENSVRCVISNV